MLRSEYVDWITCTGGEWWALRRLSPCTVDARAGVYVIWCNRGFPRVVRIGQSGGGRTGSIGARLSEHRNNKRILRLGEGKGLYVTWTAVSNRELRKGIERYLARVLVPVVGSRFPRAVEVRVNLPWLLWDRPSGSQMPLGGGL